MVAKRLAQRLQYFQADDFFNPNRAGVALPTKEGVSAVKEAVAYLTALDPLEELASGLIGGLTLSAEDHCADVGASGTTTHRSSDGSGID